MDAMDINWCLTCNRHIDSDASVPYCSRVCYASDQPSSSSVYPCLRQAEYAPAATSVCDSDDYDESEYEPSLPSTERSQWIGKGAAGIEAWARNVHPGPPCSLEHAPSTSDLRPKLLLPHRRPIPPTLCMSKTDPAPPAPSKPILTPHRSLASQCTPGASTASYTTPASSLSLATPVSENAFRLPSAAAHDGKPGLIGALTKQFRVWTLSHGKPPARGAMASRAGRALSPVVIDDESSYTDVKIGHDESEVWPTTLGWFEKAQQDSASPHSWQVAPEHHPAYIARGRRSSRAIS